MTILGIDSSAGPASAGVVREGRLLGDFFLNTKQTHSQTLLPMIQSLLDNLGLSCGELDQIAVTQGPGSFTGVRIGIACAKGLALPRNTPCLGVSTLEAIAYGCLGQEGQILCPAMDARREQVYNALFQVKEGALCRLTQDRAISLDELEEACQAYGDRLILCGDGAELCHRRFARWGAKLAPEAQRFQRGASAALLAQGRPGEEPGELRPVYLRLPQAERELRKRQGKES